MLARNSLSQTSNRLLSQIRILFSVSVLLSATVNQTSLQTGSADGSMQHCTLVCQGLAQVGRERSGWPELFQARALLVQKMLCSHRKTKFSAHQVSYLGE